MNDETGFVLGRSGLRNERASGERTSGSSTGELKVLSWKPLRESQSLPEISRESHSFPLWKRRLEGRTREGGGRGNGRGETERSRDAVTPEEAKLVCERDDRVRVRVLPMRAIVLNLTAGGVGGLVGGLRDGESSVSVDKEG